MSTTGPRLTIGNLSLVPLLDAWGSPVGRENLKSGKEEAEAFVADCRRLGADAAEGMVAWAVTEPQEGVFDFSGYRDIARRLHAEGLGYVAFAWPQYPPRWARGDPSAYERARCREHGEEIDFMSIFSDATVERYDRFLGALAAHMGEDIDELRVGSPYDFGETCYPSGMAAQLLPLRHAHGGFWCAEPSALTKWKSDTGLTSFPDASASNLEWFHFVEWYHRSFTDRFAVLLDVARRHFPETPLLVSTGLPNEPVTMGQDLSGIIAMAAGRRVHMRAPTGPAVPFLYSLRVAAAGRWYQPPSMGSEPANGSAAPEALALALFKDVAGGCRWHFDYVANIDRGQDAVASFMALPASLHGRSPDVDAAVFFPSADHRASRPSTQVYKGYPDGLLSFVEGIRALVEVDVVDERLVLDGALARYGFLLWPLGELVTPSAADAISRWVRDGGRLLLAEDLSPRLLTGGEPPMQLPAGVQLLAAVPRPPYAESEQHSVWQGFAPEMRPDHLAWSAACGGRRLPELAATFSDGRVVLADGKTLRWEPTDPAATAPVVGRE